MTSCGVQQKLTMSENMSVEQVTGDFAIYLMENAKRVIIN